MADTSNRRNAEQRRDLYQEVTDKVVGMMEQGVNPFAPDWDGSKCPTTPRPRNAVTGERYHGVNEMLLGAHPDPRFCTLRQANAKGWRVNKGEHGTPVIFFDKKEIKNRDRQGEDDPEKVVVPVARAYTVFHVSQLVDKEGKPLPPWTPPTVEEAPWMASDAVERVVEGCKAEGITFLEQGDKAFYSPSRDTVVTPPRGAFVSQERFDAVRLHEISHASGSARPGRLNREFGKRFGDKAYAFEELCAESSAAYSAAELGVSRGEESLQHAAGYLKSWAEVLKQDKRAIFTACARGAEACEWLLERHPDYKAAMEAERAAKAERKAAPAAAPKPEANDQVADQAKAAAEEFYRLEGIDKSNKDAIKAEYPPRTLHWNRGEGAWEIRKDNPLAAEVVERFGTAEARAEARTDLKAAVVDGAANGLRVTGKNGGVAAMAAAFGSYVADRVAKAASAEPRDFRPTPKADLEEEFGVTLTAADYAAEVERERKEWETDERVDRAIGEHYANQAEGDERQAADLREAEAAERQPMPRRLPMLIDCVPADVTVAYADMAEAAAQHPRGSAQWKQARGALAASAFEAMAHDPGQLDALARSPDQRDRDIYVRAIEDAGAFAARISDGKLAPPSSRSAEDPEGTVRRVLAEVDRRAEALLADDQALDQVHGDAAGLTNGGAMFKAAAMAQAAAPSAPGLRM